MVYLVVNGERIWWLLMVDYLSEKFVEEEGFSVQEWIFFEGEGFSRGKKVEN